MDYEDSEIIIPFAIATEVELRHVGELEGVWHKKDGGTATCEYNGRWSPTPIRVDSVRSDHGIDTATESSVRWKNEGYKVSG